MRETPAVRRSRAEDAGRGRGELRRLRACPRLPLADAARKHVEESTPWGGRVTTAIDCLVNVDFGDQQAARVDGPGEGGLLQGRRLVLQEPRAARAARRHGRQRRRAGDPHDAGSARPASRPGRSATSRRAPDRFALGVGGFNLLRADEDACASLESFVARPPGRLRRRSARASGATACTRRPTPSTTRSTRSAASSTCRCA